MSIMNTPQHVARMGDLQLLSRVLGRTVSQRPQSLAQLCGLSPASKGSDANPEMASTADRSARFTLDCARELFVRALHESLSRHRTAFSQPDSVKAFLQLRLAGKAYEVFCVMFLDSQHRLIACDDMFTGTLTQTSVYPREVVKRAFEYNACSVVLAHNHPSGSAQPSRADENLTQTLKAALALIDVRVLDHIIVGEGIALSMAQQGLM
jgi:DNA repair protein RadC